MITVPSILNETYPSLFTDHVTLDEAIYPMSVAQPNHDPRIFAACVLGLICGGAAVAIGLAKITFYTYVHDASYLRGFCAMMAAVVSLLLVAETTLMYQSGIDSLNLLYPHLRATAGPGMTMMGIALMVFFLSSLSYMNGCLSRDTSDEGYEPL
ncbi:hypothetical protein BCR42DRAFT_114191 [Absidia repens]|uniref:Uncharacterized protein n=1 Tax=Absidia repens TaxID=90262 RepID=A0A1X2I646_9FUNG|nr:hypothetical protein BCR42DRAFT_114191 [Absidia repens]